MCNICNYMYTLYRNFFWSPHVFIPSPFFSRWRPMARPRSRLLVTCSRASSGCAAKMPTKPLATTCRATVTGTAQKRRDKNDRNPGKRWWYSNFYVYIHIYIIQVHICEYQSDRPFCFEGPRGLWLENGENRSHNTAVSITFWRENCIFL